MCRNIRVLFHFQPPATDDEIAAAALQYVRKISGTTRPTRANQAVFDRAVAEITAVTGRLIREGLVPAGPPRTREREAEKAKERGRKRDQQVRLRVMRQPERVRFLPFDMAAPAAEAAFDTWRQVLGRLVPGAEIEHVGATSIPGSLTKGDLDICVRVEAEDFPAADAALSGAFARNVGSTHSASYSSFKDDRSDPPLGIQLVVRGGPEDFFLWLRDRLRASPEHLAALNAIRARNDGGTMDAYRAEKAAYYEGLLAERSG